MGLGWSIDDLVGELFGVDQTGATPAHGDICNLSSASPDAPQCLHLTAKPCTQRGVMHLSCPS